MATNRVQIALRAVRRFIGPGGRAFRNEAGDLVVQSRDEIREVRFDFNNPYPHWTPHVHVIEYERVKNEKEEIFNERVYFPPNPGSF